MGSVNEFCMYLLSNIIQSMHESGILYINFFRSVFYVFLFVDRLTKRMQGLSSKVTLSDNLFVQLLPNFKWRGIQLLTVNN